MEVLAETYLAKGNYSHNANIERENGPASLVAGYGGDRMTLRGDSMGLETLWFCKPLGH
jgi:hypothetical protein